MSYSIVYEKKVNGTKTVYDVYIPGNRTYCLNSAKLSLECGAAGSLTISIPDVNPSKDIIEAMKGEIIVKKGTKEIFRGQPINSELDFQLTGKLTCRGVLSYLMDMLLEPGIYNGTTIFGFLSAVLQKTRSFSSTDYDKYFTISRTDIDIEGKTPDDSITRIVKDYTPIYTVLKEKMADRIGGYFYFAGFDEHGIKRVGFKSVIGKDATQSVELGSNIIDIAKNIRFDDFYTAVLAHGGTYEDEDDDFVEKTLSISAVNSGNPYYVDTEAQSEYGFISCYQKWEDINIIYPDHSYDIEEWRTLLHDAQLRLKEKAKEFIDEHKNPIRSFTVKAVDLSNAYDNVEALELGDMVTVKSIPHGINQKIMLYSEELDLLNPANDVLTFGKTEKNKITKMV